MNFIKNILKHKTFPNYRIVSKTCKGETFYLIQKRIGLRWDFLYDSIGVGYDKHEVDYAAFYINIDDAIKRINTDQAMDEFNKLETKVVRFVYNKIK